MCETSATWSKGERHIRNERVSHEMHET